jgi:hypothetical protein
MQHCEECGLELPTDARFCVRCGRSTGSETGETTDLSDTPIEDLSMSPLASSTALGGLRDPVSENDQDEQQPQDPALENDEEEEQQPSISVSKDDVEDEQLTPPSASENDQNEQQPQDPALENDEEEEQQPPHHTSESDEEEEKQLLHENLESTSSLPRDPEPEPEKSASQLLDENPQHDRTPSGTLEARSPRGSAPRRRLRSVPMWLLILLTGLIVAAGGAVALFGLFPEYLPGMGRASNALSSSSVSETVRTAGPSLNTYVCASSPARSTPGTSGGIGLTLSTGSGCSSFSAAAATSSCLIFPYNFGAFHRYILDISNATVDSKAYHLVLSIAEYTGPATYDDAVHVTVGIGEGSIGSNFSWVYRSGNVTINSDEQSGTMDVVLESESSGNTIQLVGGWMCGRLIKNP